MSRDGLREEAEAFFARDDIWDNLVSMTAIADRTGSPLNTCATWLARYDDFPAAIHPGRAGYMALYWWPDVQAFMKRRDLPGPKRGEPRGSTHRGGRPPKNR